MCAIPTRQAVRRRGPRLGKGSGWMEGCYAGLAATVRTSQMLRGVGRPESSVLDSLDLRNLEEGVRMPQRAGREEDSKAVGRSPLDLSLLAILPPFCRHPTLFS